MIFPTQLLDSWISEPPRILLIGDGPYARAAAHVFGATTILPSDKLTQIIDGMDNDRIPQVLFRLETVVLVAGMRQSASDLIRWHEVLWLWIERLSPEGEQHEIVTLFVLPPSSADGLSESLAVGLGMEKIDPKLGLGVIRMGDSLEALCRAVSSIRPCDLPPLRALQAGNARHRSVRQLLQAETPGDLVQAARNMRECFNGKEYHLDLFCRQPSHRNGNLLRQWLREAVTGSVTPESLETTRINLAEWLRPT